MFQATVPNYQGARYWIKELTKAFIPWMKQNCRKFLNVSYIYSRQFLDETSPLCIQWLIEIYR